MNFTKHITLSLLVTASAFAMEAYAGIGKVGGSAIGKVGGGTIGKVGSPVVPSNMPKKAATNDDGNAHESTANSEEAERSPVMTISFSQHRVNFDKMLAQAISANENDAPGGLYELESDIPTDNGGAAKASRASTTYVGNVAAVVERMGASGVGSERIHVTAVSKDELTNQEVNIYAVVKKAEEPGAENADRAADGTPPADAKDVKTGKSAATLNKPKPGQ